MGRGYIAATIGDVDMKIPALILIIVSHFVHTIIVFGLRKRETSIRRL
jgi:hypothetical protein